MARSIDCHAHVSPDVTDQQVQALEDAVVFAVTNSLAEARRVRHRTSPGFGLVWGCGTHPGDHEAIDSFDRDDLRELASSFALVGEVGLDRRAGRISDQSRVFGSVLDVVADMPVLVSVHSRGSESLVLEALAKRPHAGAILHWFKGNDSEFAEAVELGCYFSANSAMSDDELRRIPLKSFLPETDFPSTRRRGRVTRPGDVIDLRRRLSRLHGISEHSVEHRWKRNLLSISRRSGAIDRLPADVVESVLLS